MRICNPTYLSRIAADGALNSFFVSVCFFTSGAAGLVYEVLWIRLIDKVIGSAPFAVATVLTVFMAGLALGSYLAGRAAERFASRAALLSLYGKLEIGIGICALMLPVAIHAITPVYQAVYDRLLAHSWCYQAVALAGCTAMLIMPAALMGATLPVLCRFYVSRLDHLGARTGWLYGLNTLGATVGVVLCGFVLIRILGVRMTLALCAGLNVLIGTVCLVLARCLTADACRPVRPAVPSPPARGAGPAGASLTVGAKRQVRWALTMFVVSGFCSMAYEVFWTRLLGLIAGPTTYCFTLVVATFIIGLALGSIVFGRLADKTQHIFTWLAGTQIAAAIGAVAVSQLLGNSQLLFAKLIHGYQDRYSYLLLMESVILFAVLLPPTLFLGAAFPLVTRLCTQSLNALGRTLGTAYALNTVGALAGSCLAGFVLIPWLGKENGLRLVILVQLCTAAAALIYMGAGFKRNFRRRLVLAGAFGAAVLMIAHYPAWHTELLSRGWYRDFDAIKADLDRAGWLDALWNGSERIADHRKGLSVVFKGEGAVGFTTVEKEITSLGTVEYAMFNSGKADASSHGDRSTQTLSAHIPMLFHPAARDVMVLGLASGMTAGEILLYPVHHLDIVEINQQVVTACRRFFQSWSNHCLDDSRTRLIVQDGRNHLALTRASYDVIISEPSNPWMAGLANLYSLEFFQLARQRLKDDGIFAQWIQSYEMDWETFALLGRTFTAVFSKSALIKVGPVDYLLLGFKNHRSDLDWSIARANAHFASYSKNVRFHGVDFLAHLVLTEDLQYLFGEGRLHTDDHPCLEFAAPLTLYAGTLDIDRIVSDKRRFSPETRDFRNSNANAETFLDLVGFAASANVPMFNMLPYDTLPEGQKTRYKQFVKDYCGRVVIPSYGIFNNSELKNCCAEIQIEAITKNMAKRTSNSMDHYNLALALLAFGRKNAAERHLRKAIALDASYAPAVTALGLLLAENGELNEAALRLTSAVELSPRDAIPHKFLGMVELRRGALASAVARLSTAFALAPDDTAILGELGIAFLQQGKCSKAVSCLEEAVKRDPRDDFSRYYLGEAKKQLRVHDQGIEER